MCSPASVRWVDGSGSAGTADGALIEWSSIGSGEPVVLIAGQAVTRHSWDDVVPVLAASFRVITFDQRGIGHSTEGDEPPLTTRGLARDVLVVLQAAGVPRAHVIGHSMGGRVAQWLAVEAPDAVGSLVLMATTGGDAGGRPRAAEITAELAGGDASRLARRFFTDVYSEAHPSAIDVFVRKEGSPATRRRAFEASATHDAWGELRNILVPTLVVHGSEDAITPPENGRALAALIPRAEYLEVAGARHAPHIGHPAVLAAIADFIERHPLPPE